jgi:tetratricopeptide (TPR) repeat protein
MAIASVRLDGGPRLADPPDPSSLQEKNMRVAMGRLSSFVGGARGVVSRGVAPVVLVLVAALGAGWLAGCASRSPARQEFVEVRTENFVVTSSLGIEETVDFVRSLEFFHAGLRALLGLENEIVPLAPTPVYLFDDRSFGRPFAVRAQTSYLLDEVEAPVLVFRGGRDFAARATPELRQRYAQRLLRDRAPVERPLWFEEGVSQLARSMDETARGSRVGAIVPEFKLAVLGWKQGELVASLNRFDLSDETRPERERFSARTWAIAHTLEFAGSPASATQTRLDAYRRALDASGPVQLERALAATGLDEEALQKQIYKHLEERRPKVRLVELRGFDVGRLTPVPLSKGESTARLGELALKIDELDLAEKHFELALKADAKNPRARIGRAVAAARSGRLDVVDATFESLALLADAPVEYHASAGDAHLAVARASASAPERRDALAKARESYGHGVRGPTPSARAQLGMAQTWIDVEGEDAREAIPWLDAARKTRPGSLELELWQARAEARMGEARLARIRLRNVVSRTHDPDQEAEARALLDSLGLVGR